MYFCTLSHPKYGLYLDRRISFSVSATDRYVCIFELSFSNILCLVLSLYFGISSIESSVVVTAVVTVPKVAAVYNVDVTAVPRNLIALLW